MRLPNVSWAGQGARDPPLRAGPALSSPSPPVHQLLQHLARARWNGALEGRGQHHLSPACSFQPCLAERWPDSRGMAAVPPRETGRPKRDPRALGRHPARGKMSLSVLPSPPLGVVLNSAPQVQVCLSAGSACMFLFLPREPAYNLIARQPRPVCAGARPLPVTGRLAG